MLFTFLLLVIKEEDYENLKDFNFLINSPLPFPRLQRDPAWVPKGARLSSPGISPRFRGNPACLQRNAAFLY